MSTELVDMFMEHVIGPRQEEVAKKRAAAQAKKEASERSASDAARVKELADRAARSRELLQKVEALEKKAGVQTQRTQFERLNELRKTELEIERQKEIRRLEKRAAKRARKGGS